MPHIVACKICGDGHWEDVPCPTCEPKKHKDDAIKLRHALKAIRSEVGTSTRAWSIANHALGGDNG